MEKKMSDERYYETPAYTVTMKDGSAKGLDVKELELAIRNSCSVSGSEEELGFVSSKLVLKETLRGLYNGIPYSDVLRSAQLCARALIETHPNYGIVAARLLLNTCQQEAFDFLEVHHKNEKDSYFKKYIAKGVELELLDPNLLDLFDLDKLDSALDNTRDFKFTYLGLQTLYDRYFIHSNQVRFELPQAFFMRVAMGLCLNEGFGPDKKSCDDMATERAIEFYNLLSSFKFMSSTPTLFNSGTLRPQLSSCFLTTIPDDLDGIYSALKDNALLSKFSGGLGNDWTPVRAMNARIKGTNGKSQGVVPFMNVANASAVAVNQGGKRKGAVCGYLETWHFDIEEFLDLRKNTGDERRRTHDMNTANWIPDLFMKRVHENKNWCLFSPNEVPDLHDLYGRDFEVAYEECEKKGYAGEYTTFKSMPAVSLWRKMLGMVFETGHPWMTFKDPCNLRSPQQHAGVVHSSNLCTEITLNTSEDEVAVCNLGSLNLPLFIKDGELDMVDLQCAIKTAVRMLDNVIDVNYYCIPQAERSNDKHRPVALGLMGFQDALHKLKIPYASDEAMSFADRSMEAISYFAIEASSNLAKERGAYKSYEGSLWSKGILPIDSIKILKESRGDYLNQNTESFLSWEGLREKVKLNGMRNSNVMAIAPTATISNIVGVTQSIEPTYQNLYVKSNMSGEFTVINDYLVNDLCEMGLWDSEMVKDLKLHDGKLKSIKRIPDVLKELYATAFEVEPKWLIEAASRRQKWIDQAQSLNLYMAQPSGKRLDDMYKLAWTSGLKTTYYLRSLGATSTEKSTIDDHSLNAVRKEPDPKVCSILDPECEACQ